MRVAYMVNILSERNYGLVITVAVRGAQSKRNVAIATVIRR